jgi:Gas vesicle synthesis protein GvpL/GvpF
MALRLFAVALVEGLHGEAPSPGTELVAVRDLAAIVEAAPYLMTLPDEDALAKHLDVVSSAFARGATVLPAPVNTVFRERHALQQWLEIHYVALSDALAFVEDRAEARVHVARINGAREMHAAHDVPSLATECFRALRRQSVASLPLRTTDPSSNEASSAFLVERGLWKEFEALAAVAGEQSQVEGIEVVVTGPWPPYDFVRIHFGG